MFGNVGFDAQRTPRALGLRKLLERRDASGRAVVLVLTSKLFIGRARRVEKVVNVGPGNPAQSSVRR
jgi:hypothetical protein